MQTKCGFDLPKYLDAHVAPLSHQIDNDSLELEKHLRHIVGSIQQENSAEKYEPLDGSVPESIYAVSTALAFTLCQHMAAQSRLASNAQWRAENTRAWLEIATGSKLVGSATTHLARRDRPAVSAVESDKQFVIDGKAPWVTGFGIFDYFVLGFETEAEIVFALVSDLSSAHQYRPGSIAVVEHHLACLQGTATVEMIFKGFAVPKSQLISRVQKPVPVKAASYNFLAPEIGMARGALKACQDFCRLHSSPRLELIKENIPLFSARIEELAKQRDNLLAASPSSRCEATALELRTSELIRDAARLLALTFGASALQKASFAARFQLEALLFDTLIQSPAVFNSKVQKVVNA